MLTAQPNTTVVFTVTSGDVTEVTASPPTLVFSPGNWNSLQTVTVAGVDDKLLDGMQMTSVRVGVADALSDDHFDTLSDQIVTVVTADDDVAGFRLDKVTASVSESGTSDTCAVILSAQPDTSVTLTVTRRDRMMEGPDIRKTRHGVGRRGGDGTGAQDARTQHRAGNQTAGTTEPTLAAQKSVRAPLGMMRCEDH